MVRNFNCSGIAVERQSKIRHDNMKLLDQMATIEKSPSAKQLRPTRKQNKLNAMNHYDSLNRKTRIEEQLRIGLQNYHMQRRVESAKSAYQVDQWE